MAASQEDAEAFARQKADGVLQAALGALSGKMTNNSPMGDGGEMSEDEFKKILTANMSKGPEGIVAALKGAGLKLDSGGPPAHGDAEQDKEMDKEKSGGPPMGNLDDARMAAAKEGMAFKPRM